MKTLLNRTLATIAAQHATLPTLLLHGGLAADVTSGQRIRQMPSIANNSNASISSNSSTILTTSANYSDTGAIQDVYNAFSGTSSSPSLSVSSSNLSGFIQSSTTAASTVLSSAITHLPTASSGPATTFPAQTMATFIAAGNKNRATTIIVYPTVSPESIVIPIVSCIFGFPILALIVICCLRRRAKLARERDRRRNYDMQDHAVSLVRFSPIHRLNYRSSRAISLRPERSLSQGFTSLELDTVLEERCSDVEQTQTEILNPESPMDTNSSYKMSFSSS
ncbi:GH12013 [Drosophila grimshawi]|nr:GH12013 [Drosophila grimshawi]